MARDSSSASQAYYGDRKHVWRSIRRRAAPAPVDGSGIGVVTPMNGRDRGTPAFKSIQVRPLSRTPALWIIVGALWVSLGMIVSATLVTMAFLT